MADVLCFGNAQIDILCSAVTALPPPGELRLIDDIAFAVGGNGATVAAVLARLGVSVELAGCRGDDLGGEYLRAALTAEGVGVEKFRPKPDLGSGISVVAVAAGGERTVIYVNGANVSFDLDTVPDDWLDGVRVVSVSSVFVLPLLTGDAVGRLFARARAHGALTILNVSHDVKGRGLSFLAPALREADYFVLSDDEARAVTGFTTPERMLSALRSYARGTIVLTLGAAGCRVQGPEEDIDIIPALPVEAADCTGAGDSFVAGFIAGLLRHWPVADCARLGCCVASYAVTGPGTYPRIPPLDEIVGRM